MLGSGRCLRPVGQLLAQLFRVRTPHIGDGEMGDGWGRRVVIFVVVVVCVVQLARSEFHKQGSNLDPQK